MWFVEIISIKEWKRFTQKSQIISLVCENLSLHILKVNWPKVDDRKKSLLT
jgi:hypothetical protein